MEKYYELKNALEYIEAHIFENCSQKEIARAACVSLSSLQKLFRYVFGHSGNEYITKRKMTLAAAELMSSSISISELASKYGYRSTEVFSRAFRRVNCCLPSSYRKGKGAQSTFTPWMLHEGDIIRQSSALIEAIQNTPNCFVVCFDVSNMEFINEISRDAGDLALMETVRRIHTYANNKMQIFRIGGDAFSVITPFENVEDAERLASAVLSHNGEKFSYKGEQIPLYLFGWFGRNTVVNDSPDPARTLHDCVNRNGII